MQISMQANEKVTVFNIHVGKNLDLRLCNTFLNVCEYATTVSPSRIVLDLSQTERVFDSGLAMLMLLNEHSYLLTENTLIKNCRPEIYQKLRQSDLPNLACITIKKIDMPRLVN